MVEYSTWVGIVFDVAKSQGFRPSFQANSEVVELAADIWQDRRTELQRASESQARAVAQAEINVVQT